MDIPSIDVIGILFKLLPGFLAAAVFHSLTAYPKRDSFDRTVNALIFTLFAQLAVATVRWIALAVGTKAGAMCVWGEDADLAWGAIAGLSLGAGWAHVVNREWFHLIFHRSKTTKKTSAPTQWFAAFSSYERYVILHLRGGKRVMGWPRQFPDEAKSGHFILEDPSWVLKDSTEIRMRRIEVFLVSAEDVESVEFLRNKNDPVLQTHTESIDQAMSSLADMHKEIKIESAPQYRTDDHHQGHESTSNGTATSI